MSHASIKFSDAAVSQTIGYVLIASLLTLSFIIIFAVGYPAYNSYVDNGHMRNMEESFDIMSYNGNNVAMHNNPYSTSEMKVYGGTLATRESGYMNISYYNSTAGPVTLCNNSLTILEYSKGIDRVAYIDGSVCRHFGDSSVMLKDPQIFGDDDTFIITQITLYDSAVAFGGNSLVRIYFYTPYYSKMMQTVTYPPALRQEDVTRIEIKVSGDYKDSFGRYLRDRYGYTLTETANGEIMASKAYPGGIDLYYSQSNLMVEAA